MSKQLYNILLAVFSMAILIQTILPCASAIGLMSAPIGTITYRPGYEQEFDFIIRRFNYDVNVSIGGDLAEYASISKVIERPDGMKEFRLKVSFPNTIDLSPGMHSITIKATEVGKPGGNVGVLTAVQKNILVEVFSKEKEIKINFFDAPNSNEHESMLFIVGVQSWSYKNISEVYAKIKLFDENNKSLAVFETNKVPLASGESTTLEAEWNNSILRPGEYTAEAEFVYDGKSRKISDRFKIGTLMIKIKNYTSNFTSGEINEFKIDIENMWNNEIKNVYADLIIDNSKVLQTPSINLKPWDSAVLNSYWNVTYAEGFYNGKIKLHYNDEFSEKNIRVQIRKKRTSASSFAVGIGIGMFILAAIVAILMLIQRRSKKQPK